MAFKGCYNLSEPPQGAFSPLVGEERAQPNRQLLPVAPGTPVACPPHAHPRRRGALSVPRASLSSSPSRPFFPCGTGSRGDGTPKASEEAPPPASSGTEFQVPPLLVLPAYRNPFYPPPPPRGRLGTKEEAKGAGSLQEGAKL